MTVDGEETNPSNLALNLGGGVRGVTGDERREDGLMSFRGVVGVVGLSRRFICRFIFIVRTYFFLVDEE